MPMKCCANCFSHEWLREFVRDRSEEAGDCGYCGHKQVEVVDVYELYEPFHNLMNLYVPENQALLVAGLSPDGQSLLDIIQCDYKVFNDDSVTSGAAARLLEEIMRSRWDDDSGEPLISAYDSYVRISDKWGHTTMADEWLDYCDAVKECPWRKPHFHPIFDDELRRLEVEVERGTVLYRSRPGCNSVDGRYEPYAGVSIGAPQPNKVKPGRANKRREVVLYVADQEETAVAEARPARGNLVSVAEIRVVENLRLVDLHAPVRPSNPFADEVPQYELEVEHLLTAFAEELARPLRRADDYREYRPCQKLAHLIRERGYDGIRYPSAMNPGGSQCRHFLPEDDRNGIGETHRSFKHKHCLQHLSFALVCV